MIGEIVKYYVLAFITKTVVVIYYVMVLPASRAFNPLVLFNCYGSHLVSARSRLLRFKQSGEGVSVGAR